MSEALLIDSFQVKRIIGENVQKVYDNTDIKFKTGELVYIDMTGLGGTALESKYLTIKVLVGNQFFMYCHKDGNLKELLGTTDRILFASSVGLGTRITATINGRLEQDSTTPKSRHITPGATNDQEGTSTYIARADHKHGLTDNDIAKALGWDASKSEYLSSKGQERLRRITYGTDEPDNNDGQNGDIYVQLK